MGEALSKASEDNTAWKQALRRDMAIRRAALTMDEHAAASARIVGYLLTAIVPPPVVAFCWPIKREPDVRAIIAHWRQAGSRAALPVVVAEAQPLAFREWSEATPLQPDRYGIPTPTAGDWLTPDLILLPLNGFDAAGYRLGYGGGYFDRTLAALTPRPLAVGVGFEINRLPSIRPEAHDQRLDWIVTEVGAFKSAFSIS
jgi:5,10-methenyltetrahydrofolate synthetase